MNKKLIAVIALAVIIIAVICLIASNGRDDAETTAPADGQPVTVNLEPETTKKPVFSPSYDKKITVTLPIDVVGEEYGDDLEAFAEAKGYFSIQKKGDSHVEIEMREYSYKLLLTSIGAQTVSTIGYTMDSGDYPFVEEFAKYNGDFSDVIFTVDKVEYEKAENKDEFFNSVAYCCIYYQHYNEDSEGKCKITLCEKDSGILIESREFTADNIK